MSWSVRRNLRRMWMIIAAAALGATLMPAAAHAVPPGRLIYEIDVTAPGTRSQGWQATLYDPAGDPIDAVPGEAVATPLGEFVGFPCDYPWDACGMIRTDMAEWMKTQQANVIMDSGSWSYHVYVDGEGSDREVWTSTLLHDGAEISPDPDGNPLTGAQIDTPMGPFRTGTPTATDWARAGWLPSSWLEPPMPGHA
ncbi:hypothetical protein ACORG1_04555 [Mycobacterium sp. TJFP1]